MFKEAKRHRLETSASGVHSRTSSGYRISYICICCRAMTEDQEEAMLQEAIRRSMMDDTPSQGSGSGTGDGGSGSGSGSGGNNPPTAPDLD